MRTVERRSCSAISPNAGTAMLVGSMRALEDENGGCLECAGANKFDRKRLADRFGGKLHVNVLEPCDGAASESDENIADDDARFVCRPFGFDVENNGGALLRPLEPMAKRIGQSHGLKPPAAVAPRSAAFLLHNIHHAVHRGRGHRNSA